MQNTSSSASLLLQENAYFEEERKKYEDEIHGLEQQHVQTHKLAEMYRNQVLALEEQLCKIREEGDVTREIYKVSFSLYLSPRDVHRGAAAAAAAVAVAAAFFSRKLKNCMNLIEFQCLQMKHPEIE